MENNAQSSGKPKKKSGGLLTLLLGVLSVLILFGTLAGVAYYYFIIKTDLPSASQGTKEVKQLKEQIQVKDGQIKVLKEENARLKGQGKSIVNGLRYVIKPRAELVSECSSAKLGKWETPASCLKDLNAKLAQTLKDHKNILVLEVFGIVDENRYKGTSPELKQEGLASFRAKKVIEILRRDFPKMTTFEGLSETKQGKRGFGVRAYSLE